MICFCLWLDPWTSLFVLTFLWALSHSFFPSHKCLIWFNEKRERGGSIIKVCEWIMFASLCGPSRQVHRDILPWIYWSLYRLLHGISLLKVFLVCSFVTLKKDETISLYNMPQASRFGWQRSKSSMTKKQKQYHKVMLPSQEAISLLTQGLFFLLLSVWAPAPAPHYKLSKPY